MVKITPADFSIASLAVAAVRLRWSNGISDGARCDCGNSADGLYPTLRRWRRGMGRVSAEDWEHVVTRDLLPFLGFGIDLKPRAQFPVGSTGLPDGAYEDLSADVGAGRGGPPGRPGPALDGGSAAVPVPMYAVRTGRLRSLREMALVRRAAAPACWPSPLVNWSPCALGGEPGRRAAGSVGRFTCLAVLSRALCRRSDRCPWTRPARRCASSSGHGESPRPPRPGLTWYSASLIRVTLAPGRARRASRAVLECEPPASAPDQKRTGTWPISDPPADSAEPGTLSAGSSVSWKLRGGQAMP